MASCDMGTPFGGPVEPEVYIRQKMSSGLGATTSTGFFWPSSTSSETLRILRSGCSFLSCSTSEPSPLAKMLCSLYTRNLTFLASLMDDETVFISWGSTYMPLMLDWVRVWWTPSGPSES